MAKSSQGRTLISIRGHDWINAESLVRGRTAVHVTEKAIIQPTTTVVNARPGGVHRPWSKCQPTSQPPKTS